MSVNWQEIHDDAASALSDSADGGFVEEYQIGRKRVRKGRSVDQSKNVAFLAGMAARQSGGLARIAKFKRPNA